MAPQRIYNNAADLPPNCTSKIEKDRSCVCHARTNRFAPLAGYSDAGVAEGGVCTSASLGWVVRNHEVHCGNGAEEVDCREVGSMRQKCEQPQMEPE